MYNTTFICTYNLINEKDEDSELSNELYRIQFLQALNLKEWDSVIIDKQFNDINNKLNETIKGKMILESIKTISTFPIEDVGLILLFSYDYFYLFHNCLIDLFNKNDISDEKYNMLIKKIENN